MRRRSMVTVLSRHSEVSHSNDGKSSLIYFTSLYFTSLHFTSLPLHVFGSISIRLLDEVSNGGAQLEEPKSH